MGASSALVTGTGKALKSSLSVCGNTEQPKCWEGMRRCSARLRTEGAALAALPLALQAVWGDLLAAWPEQWAERREPLRRNPVLP
jgi:hypothetical protein